MERSASDRRCEGCCLCDAGVADERSCRRDCTRTWCELGSSIAGQLPPRGREGLELLRSQRVMRPSRSALPMRFVLQISSTRVIANTVFTSSQGCPSRRSSRIGEAFRTTHGTQRSMGQMIITVPIGSHLPHAVGHAYAERMKGNDVVTMTYIGDGGTSENDFHSGFELRRCVEDTDRVHRLEQPLCDLRPVRKADGCSEHRRQGDRIRHPI